MSLSNRKKGEVTSDISVEQWLQIEAKSRLSEAFSKIGLDTQKINGKHLQAYTVDELQSEKKKVKNELKFYDQAFQNKFNRVPNRNEKEPMRNLYLYYKRLKQYIKKKEQIQNSVMN